MSRKIGLKELIILGILIVIAAYYFLFHMPVSKQMDAIEAEQVQVQSELDVAQYRVMDLHNMESALNEIRSSNAVPEPLPQYNNIDGILLDLNTIMAGTNYYEINFSDAVSDGFIARRTIGVKFSVPAYSAAVAKIKEINESDNRYLITDMSMNKGNNNEIILGNSDAFTSVTVTLTSFDYISPTGEQPPTTEKK